MRVSSSGSIEVPSKDPHEVMPWDDDGWKANHRLDGVELGSGGYGRVDRVVHLASGEFRALKRPLSNSPEVRARFKREIEVQERIKDRHVMPIFERDPNFRWCTMPLASRTLLQAAPEMSEEELARSIVHVARGLDAAHKLGLVHRDVKPSNILEMPTSTLGDPCDWVVGDFGIVRRPANDTTSLKTRHALGTDGYMAPEVGLGSAAKITPSADIYSLGRTIAWALTGIRPTRYEPLEAPHPWTSLVGDMTEFEPADRPATMAVVIDEIDAIVRLIRSMRAKAWGKESQALPPVDQLLLAHVFEQAWDPDDEHGEIAATFENLKRVSSSRANVRISLHRLVEYGYLRPGWYQGRDESMRTYIPTEKAWNWAARNQERVDMIVRAPEPESPAAPEVAGAVDSDIPF